ncbi:MAG: hypothetical protein OP8BY_1446 [Candidatus Saccharicenans subterraneus]|uniref:Uncharacterized protein n=1 Tax=Candidatus Saccharicenans subterraneus TaxID=2508984 RepID=A0A3E2BJZ1_9BACT|nr:MAG: hypothetical protein OP8BY_1446 [Candidatus Saccharicenans subterraneum]
MDLEKTQNSSGKFELTAFSFWLKRGSIFGFSSEKDLRRGES